MRNLAHDPWQAGERTILRAALQVMAEGMAQDGLARGRQAKRREVLRQAIEYQRQVQNRRATEASEKPRMPADALINPFTADHEAR